MPGRYSPEYEAEILAWEHPKANNPYKPFSAVSALFNGDLYLGEPQWAPRTHWEVVSPYHIQHLPINKLIESDQAEPKTDK